MNIEGLEHVPAASAMVVNGTQGVDQVVELRRHDVVMTRPAADDEIRTLALRPGAWVFHIDRPSADRPLVYPLTVILYYPGPEDGDDHPPADTAQED